MIHPVGGPSRKRVPIPPEYKERITRESDPRGRAPFRPDDRRLKEERFFGRREDRRAQARSRREDRKEMFMNEINLEREQRDMEREEQRDIRRSRQEERRMRREEMGGRRRRRIGRRSRRPANDRPRDFTRRRSRMERRRSQRERAAFRDRFVSTLRR